MNVAKWQKALGRPVSEGGVHLLPMKPPPVCLPPWCPEEVHGAWESEGGACREIEE